MKVQLTHLFLQTRQTYYWVLKCKVRFMYQRTNEDHFYFFVFIEGNCIYILPHNNHQKSNISTRLIFNLYGFICIVYRCIKLHTCIIEMSFKLSVLSLYFNRIPNRNTKCFPKFLSKYLQTKHWAEKLAKSIKELFFVHPRQKLTSIEWFLSSNETQSNDVCSS